MSLRSFFGMMGRARDGAAAVFRPTCCLWMAQNGMPGRAIFLHLQPVTVMAWHMRLRGFAGLQRALRMFCDRGANLAFTAERFLRAFVIFFRDLL